MKIYLVLVALFCTQCSAQKKDAEFERYKKAYKINFTDLYTVPSRDYTKSYSGFESAVDVEKKTISPFLAISLYNSQKIRYSIKDYQLFLNEKQIPLFENYETIKKKFPEINMKFSVNDSETGQDDNYRYTEIDKNLTLNFVRYKDDFFFTGLRYLKPFSSVFFHNEDNYNMFLIDTLPVSGDDDLISTDFKITDIINQGSKYGFHYSQSRTYSSAFENVQLINTDILSNYFSDKERYRRMANKKISTYIIFSTIGFETRLTYDGLNP